MRILLLTLLLATSHALTAQIAEDRVWYLSTSLSYGSENNWGNPGAMLQGECEYRFRKSLSISGRLGLFHSFPLFTPDGFYFQFGSASAGVHLNYIKNFNQDRNYVRFSSGPAYFHNNFLASGSQVEFGSENKFGLGVAMDGGMRIHETLSIGIILSTYSYDIFGDLITVGAVVRVQF